MISFHSMGPPSNEPKIMFHVVYNAQLWLCYVSPITAIAFFFTMSTIKRNVNALNIYLMYYMNCEIEIFDLFGFRITKILDRKLFISNKYKTNKHAQHTYTYRYSHTRTSQLNTIHLISFQKKKKKDKRRKKMIWTNTKNKKNK